MSEFIRIANWETVFENNRSNEIKNLQWVIVPNRHDGAKYAELMDHKNGPAHFAAWILMVQVASRCGNTAATRGILRRGDGTPYNSKSLALMTRCPDSIFSEAIPRLLKLGWLKIEGKEHLPQDGAGLPQDGAGLPQDGAENLPLKGIELNGTEQNNNPPTPQGGDGLELEFEKARQAYPGSKRGLETEYTNFRKKYRGEFERLIPLLLPAIEKQKRHKDKLDAMKAFVPNWKNFKTWINNRCWEEEPEKEVYVK